MVLGNWNHETTRNTTKKKRTEPKPKTENQRPKPENRRPNLFLHIAVNNRNIVLFFFQFIAKAICDHYRPMSSARASDPDREVRLPFALIKRQKIFQHVRKTID